MTDKLPYFWRQALEKKLLEKQGWTLEKLQLSEINPQAISLHNTSIADVIQIIEKLIK